MNKLDYSKVRRKAERLKRHDRKRRIKAKTYYDKSCPKCGKPDKGYNQGSLNRFGSPIMSKKHKCILCKGKLNENL